MDAGVILAVLILNAIIGFVQEQQAAEAMDAFGAYDHPESTGAPRCHGNDDFRLSR
jgi:magnesium-transporting ATPase (P-type)